MNINFRKIFKKSNSAQEAQERKDTSKKVALGLLGGAIALTILGSLIKLAFLESIGMILIVLSVVCFYFWFIAKSELSRFQTIFCECGEKYTYPENVTYKKGKEQISSGKDPNNGNIIRHTNTSITLYCKCQKCNKERTVETTFITEKNTFNQRGVLLRTNTYPLEDQIESFFNK